MTRATIFAIPLAFAIGCAMSSFARARSAPAPAAIGSVVAPAASSCIDPHAMKANENLVSQLQDYKHRQELAAAAAHTAEVKAATAKNETAMPSMISTPREEWKRMAKDGRFRIRRPCANGAYKNVTDLEAAGFDEHETELLEEAYEHSQARTWSSMRAACEEGPFFAQAVAESTVSSESDLVDICQASLLPDDDDTHAAMQRVAESRGAGRGVPGPEARDRVAFALSESMEVLFDEMTKRLGREKALRAVDYGLICYDEKIVVTRVD